MSSKSLWKLNLTVDLRFKPIKFTDDQFIEYIQKFFMSYISSSTTGLTLEFPNWNAAKVLHVLPTTLKYINLNAVRGLDDGDIATFLIKQTQCEMLELYWQLNIDRQTCMAIGRGMGKTLTHLNLSGCQAITDESFSFIVERCRGLKFLDLTRPTAMNGTALHMIGEQLHELETLILYACHNLASQDFIALSRLSKLKKLDICGSKASDEAVCAIIKSNPNLEFLNLTWNLCLTDKTVYAIARNLKKLETLSLHGLTNITAAGIRQWSKNGGSQSVKALDIRGCTATEELHIDLDSLKLLFPLLNNVELHS